MSKAVMKPSDCIHSVGVDRRYPHGFWGVTIEQIERMYPLSRKRGNPAYNDLENKFEDAGLNDFTKPLTSET